MHSSRIFLPGQAVSLFGDGLAILAVPLAVLQLTDNPLLAALASAPRLVGYLIAGLPAGPLVDRTDPWRVLITADVARLMIFLTLSGAITLRVCPVAVVLGLAIAAGIAGVFFETALTVAVRDLYDGQKLLRTNAFLETSGQLSIVLGPAAVGLLAAGCGVGAALLVNAMTFAVSLATLWRTARSATSVRVLASRQLSEPTTDQVPITGTLHRSYLELRAGLRYLTASTILGGLVLLQVITNFAQGSETLIPYFARERLGASTALVGLVVAGGGVGGVLGALCASTIAARLPPISLCALGALSISGALGLIGVAPDVLCLAAAHALLAGASVLVVVVVRTLRQQLVPRAMLGRVTSAARSAILAAATSGALLAGLLTRFDGNNPRPIFVCAALIIALSTPIVWLNGLARHRHLPPASNTRSSCVNTSS
ncbi:MFS transporter [Nocardia sp. NBC_01327]|uniref:MFS transporter n=1 Tax=Nocardia sp. NBC_01327 TaxID=2903593 RepID=UPI002E15DFE7|nr:MFS transporter [Nocardia sp. NBC_01327]